jgi:hypothetical protein
MHDREAPRTNRSVHADEEPARPAPGHLTLTSRLAPVQRKEAAAPALDPFAIHLVAEDGVAGASSPLPYHDELRASFGRHGGALDGARAQIGGPAADASAAIGAQAYATGDRVAFASAPDRALAGHEAAHVVQQRAGVARKATLSAASDPFEEHADHVGAAFARGESVEPLLDRMPAGAASGAVQRKEAPPAQDPAPAAPVADNPTYVTARLSIVEWFQKQITLATLVIQHEQAAFEKFKKYSSKEFNDRGNLPLTILELALNLVPAAASLASLVAEIRVGSKALQLAKDVEALGAARTSVNMEKQLAARYPAAYRTLRNDRLDQIAAAKATIVDSKDALKTAKQGAEKASSAGTLVDAASDTGGAIKAGADIPGAAATGASEDSLFELKTIDTISQFEDEALGGLLLREGKLQELMESVRTAGPEWDLDAYVKQNLGEMTVPMIEEKLGLLPAAEKAFELQLYKTRYLDTHEAVYQYVHSDYYGTDTEGVYGLPDAVEARIRELGGEALLTPGNLKQVHVEQPMPHFGHDR